MSSASAPRLIWIDLLRGLAVIGMIETHVINAVLDARFDGSRWLHELMSFDGLIAPMFLWIAGYAQGLAIQKALNRLALGQFSFHDDSLDFSAA